MSDLDYKRLVQFMGMTESVGDGEALNAIRMANRLLRAAGKTWAEVLAPPVARSGATMGQEWRTHPSQRKKGREYGRTVKRERRREQGRVTSDDIQVMLSAVTSRRLSMNTMMFVASLNDHWERLAFLTEPQYEALKSIHSEGRF